MQKTQYKGEERQDNNIEYNYNCKDCCLQFYKAFRYNHKGPYYVYFMESKEEKAAAQIHIKALNKDTKTCNNKLQIQAQQALDLRGDSNVNRRYNTRKLQYVPSQMDYKRGDRSCGGVDSY